MLRAGDLRQTINVDDEAVTKGTSGGMQRSWVPFLQDVPAHVVHQSGAEKQETSQGGRAAVSTKLFRIRFEPGLHSRMTIVYDGDRYDIDNINNVGERDVVLAITATKGKGNA